MPQIDISSLPLGEYVAGFRDAVTCLEACRQCRNYGQLWCCPPLGFDVDAMLGSYANATIVLASFPWPSATDYTALMAHVSPARLALERQLITVESPLDGRAFGFSGECLLCRQCRRPLALPCAHPDKVRPSLEACGFNVCATVEQLFGQSMEWAAHGCNPHTLRLVGAIFHNAPIAEAKKMMRRMDI